MVKASVDKGKNMGYHVGRVAIRASGSFNITTKTGIVQGVNYKHCTLMSRNDGYGYFLTQNKGDAIPL